MTQLKLTYLLLTVVLIGCSKKISPAEFEQSVFDEVFITVVDSTYKDQRLYTFFPKQGSRIYDKNGKWIGFDTIGQYQRDIDYKKKRRALEKDTLDLVIAVANEGLINEKTNLEKYKSSKFIFKHLNDHPKDNNHEYSYWKTNYKFAGVMSFSNIKFDPKKESGTLEVSYSCGRGRCGLGYSVYIKKINDEWVVSKVTETWIS